MTTRSDIEGHIRRLDLRHRDDGDGGYSFLRDIGNYREELGALARGELRVLLISLVASKDRHLWGIALEALVQEADPLTAQGLYRLLGTRESDREWTDQLVLGLLRLGDRDSAKACTSYVSDAIRDGRFEALPLLAALCRVDSAGYLQIAGEFFANALRSRDTTRRVDRYFPAFVRNLLVQDPSLIKELVRETRRASLASGEQLREMFIEHLSKPWIVKEYTSQRLGELREALESALEQ